MGNFKVGDKVELLNGGYEYPLHGFKNGEVYKVIGESLSSDTFDGDTRKRIKIENGSKQGYALPQDLKPIEPKPSKKQRIETLEKEVSELKLIVHELRERKEVTLTLDGVTLAKTSTGKSVEDKQADVIEFEGQQYRKVEREAVEGDVVTFNADTVDERWVTKGKFYKAYSSASNERLLFKDDDGDALHVYGGGVANGTPETVDVYEPIQPVQHQTVPCSAQTDKTANELRAEIIEKAKVFFETNSGNEFVFSVDENKCTAFCWKLVSNGCGYNTIHGLSTCHPNDVFNEHIGKAIALGRALGLDVSEFEQAVQPDEVVPGMLVENKGPAGGIYEIKKVDGYKLRIDSIGSYFERDLGVIINDTNAIYGGVE